MAPSPFVFVTPVRFADVDHAGIVYYPRFFHYFHLAFEELWRARVGGRAYVELLDRERTGFPAVHAECDFSAPLRFGDVAEIELTVSKIGASSITFHYRVYRQAEDDRARALAADGRVVCAIVDLAKFASIEVPDRVRHMVHDLIETE